MKKFRHILTAVTATFVISLGCGDDNPAGGGGGGGSPAGGANGANATVTSANAATVWATTFSQAFAALGQGFSVITKPVTPGGSGVVNGTNSGTATFTGNLTSGANGTVMDASVVFDNFSNDGSLWMQGTLDVDLTLAQTGINGSYTGDFEIAGAYQASLDMDLTFTNNLPSGSISITSGGSTFSYTI